MVAAQELSINTDASALQMADAMFGSGISVTSASYTGDGNSSGIYTGATETMPGVAPSDSGVILSTGHAEDITNSEGEANQSTSTTTDTSGVDGDAGLNAIAGMQTYDAAIFEATFIPEGNVLSMQLNFSSEEYLEWVDSGYNDAVGIWVNGVQAELTMGDSEISIDEINPDSNSDWYIDNADDQYNTEMDGMTITLTLRAPVIPGQENTIKIGIADAGDSQYDSNLMIAGDSIQTAVVVADDEVSIGAGDEQNIDVLANDTCADGCTLSITHINGQPLVEGTVITLNSGVEVSLNEDGTLNIVGADDEDETTFTYSVVDDDGNEGSGYVTVNTVPCFVTGTMIDTARGRLPVETLMPGDLVLTRDHGYQPVRWSGTCNVITKAQNAPIEIAAGALGNHGELIVSPQHRVLMRDLRAQLMFDANEVLIPAKHLLNHQTVRRKPVGERVTYVHVLFDRHEVLRSNGMWTESYLPGPEAGTGFDADVQKEILSLFPQLDLSTGRGYGPAARLSLREFETQALLAS